MLNKLQTSIPQDAQAKLDHNNVIEKLTSILNQQPQEQDPEAVLRVGADAPPLRVAKQTRTTYPTEPDTVKTSKCIHL